MSLSIGFKSLYSTNYCSNACSFAGNKPKPIKFPPKNSLSYLLHHENIAYFNTFVKYAGMADYKPGNNPQNIYAIGCGTGEELPVIHTFFNEKRDLISVLNDCGEDSEIMVEGKHKSNVKIKAIENNPIDFCKAKQGNRSLQGIEYAYDDARNVLKNESGKIDVAVIRHPSSYEGNKKPWEEIFKQSYEKLREGGIIFITTHYDHEKDLFEKIAKKEKMNIIVNEVNSEAFRFKDEYVFVVKK